MPTFPWSCPACGSHNPPELTTCSTCRCPSVFNTDDVAHFRRKFQAEGGSVNPAVLQEMDVKDIDVLKTLLLLQLLLLGWWPSPRINQDQK
jgi:hypothetical protein